MEPSVGPRRTFNRLNVAALRNPQGPTAGLAFVLFGGADRLCLWPFMAFFPGQLPKIRGYLSGWGIQRKAAFGTSKTFFLSDTINFRLAVK